MHFANEWITLWSVRFYVNYLSQQLIAIGSGSSCCKQLCMPRGTPKYCSSCSDSRRSTDWNVTNSATGWPVWGCFNPASEGHEPMRWIYWYNMAAFTLFYLYDWYIVWPITSSESTLFIIIIIIIIKKYWQCKAGRGRLTPYQSEDPSPTHYQPIKEKKWKGK